MKSDLLPIGEYEKILLIRHGTTEANSSGKYSGTTDWPLCSSGAAQLLERRKELIGKGLSDWFDDSIEIKLLSSPLKRCLQTSKILWPDIKPEIEPGLIETNFGRWEGLDYEQLKSDPAYISWLDASPPGRPAPPDGESGITIMTRLESLWTRLLELSKFDETPKRLAIITHGGIIMYLMTLITDQPLNFYSWQTRPGGAWLIDRKDYKPC